MPFSLIQAAFVGMSLVSLMLFSFYVYRHPERRRCMHALLARPLIQMIAMIVLAGTAAALLSAIPMERNGRIDTLLQATIEATGAGIPEAGSSAPFALVDDNGETLKHAGHKLADGASKTVHLTKYTLVAAIAGGVTSFTCILFTAAFLGARQRQPLTEGIRMLGTFYWRPAMITGAVIWMITTWLLLLWPDWHVLGTTADGCDRLAILFGLSPWATCAGIWFLILSFFLRRPKASI